MVRGAWAGAEGNQCRIQGPREPPGAVTYDREIEPILQRFGIDEGTVDGAETVRYLRSHTEEIDLPAEIDSWREDLIQYGLDELAERSSDPND